MTLIDFLIGLFLMNALPHFVLGIWKGRMLSGYGIGDKQNILYSLTNFVLAMALFIYKYGISGILENGIFAGGLFVLLMYYLTGKFWYNKFGVKSTQ